MSATLTVDRYLTELRLAVAGIILGVALTVGFGMGEAVGSWVCGVGSGLVSVPLLVVLLRWRPSRHALIWIVQQAIAQPKR